MFGLVVGLIGLVLLVTTVSAAFGQVVAPPAPHPPRPIAALDTVPVPVPPNLGDFIQDTSPNSPSMKAALQLGKALFWDMQVGSDEVQACASCHFAAGADNRAQNQINPGANKAFNVGPPNYKLKQADFPFHKVDAAGNVVRDSDDIASSQGVFNTEFKDILLGPLEPGKARRVAEDCLSGNDAKDPDGFRASNLNTRRVEPRNAPTVINAVYNFRNFWDGRANNDFNGRNPFGRRDTDPPTLLKDVGEAQPKAVTVSIPLGSLASQAVGPPGSQNEMSCNGRPFEKIGQKLLAPGVKPLAKQEVKNNDSVLGPLADGDHGLKVSYAQLIQKAFKPEWWRNGTPIPRPAALLKREADRNVIDIHPHAPRFQPLTTTVTQMEANFSLFFGLSVQLYEATLVADQTPFDKFLNGKGTLTTEQRAGLGVFSSQFGGGEGKCDACHGGPELTNASVANVANERLERMVMGNDGIAVYDDGFYNTAVRPTSDDIGVGGTDKFGNPLSEVAFCQKQQNPADCPIKNIDPNGQLQNTSIGSTITPRPANPPDPAIAESPLAKGGSCSQSSTFDAAGKATCDRINVMGAFKTPGLRNVELTGPYMHNGGMLTLRQVVDFYDRGGDFAHANQDNLDPNIVPLGLTDEQKHNLVAFMLALTDERVRYEKAPFDHPQLFVPNGEKTPLVQDKDHPGQATDQFREIQAVGRGGVEPEKKLKPYLNANQYAP